MDWAVQGVRQLKECEGFNTASGQDSTDFQPTRLPSAMSLKTRHSASMAASTNKSMDALWGILYLLSSQISHG